MTASSTPLGLRPDISFHPLGHTAALFDPVRYRVFTLGPAEAVAWCLLSEAGSTVASAGHALAALSGRTREDAEAWLSDAFAQWSAAGLVGAPPVLTVSEIEASEVPEAVSPILPTAFAAQHRYRMLDLVVEVGFTNADAATAADTVLAGLCTDAPPQAAMALLRDGEGWALVTEGRVVERAPRLAQAIPMLKLALTRLALSRTVGFAAVHAAAVGCSAGAVLLPGPAGVGKSTLAAGCALSGWEVVADDTAVLCAGPDDATLLRPLPLAFCLKAGSWAPLATVGAALDSLAIHERLDGKWARYLAPPCAADGPRSLAAVVFPCWRSGGGRTSAPAQPPRGLRSADAATLPVC